MFDKPYVTCDMNKVEVRNHGKHVIHAVDIGSSDDATIS